VKTSDGTFALGLLVRNAKVCESWAKVTKVGCQSQSGGESPCGSESQSESQSEYETRGKSQSGYESRDESVFGSESWGETPEGRRNSERKSGETRAKISRGLVKMTN